MPAVALPVLIDVLAAAALKYRLTAVAEPSNTESAPPTMSASHSWWPTVELSVSNVVLAMMSASVDVRSASSPAAAVPMAPYQMSLAVSS